MYFFYFYNKVKQLLSFFNINYPFVPIFNVHLQEEMGIRDFFMRETFKSKYLKQCPKLYRNVMNIPIMKEG